MDSTRIVLALSGGQDSTTCLAWAVALGLEVWPVTIHYGQRHLREVEAAHKIVHLAGLADRHEVIRLPSGILASSSPLVDAQAEVGQYPDAQSLPGGVESTFIPGRNILFLTLLANRAIKIGAASLLIGVSQEDYGGYHDCRETFILAMQEALNWGLIGKPQGLVITAPLLHLSKRETVLLGEEVGAGTLLAHSHTCYRGEYPPCGHCHACLLRQRGFDEAEVLDPLLVRAGEEGLL